MTTWTVARLSFKETIRKRVLLVCGIFALALMLSAPFWPAMTDADRVRLVQDISLTAMAFLGVIVAVFTSAYSLPGDIDQRRIFTIASKPVRRHEIVLGKLCGFLMVFAVILAVMGILSDVVIRSVSTFSRVTVTTPQAPIILHGSVIGAVDNGRELRITAAEGDYYQVVLPDDLTVKKALVAKSDVHADTTTRQVRVTSPEAELVHNGIVIARAAEGDTFAMEEAREDAYLVHVPERLRIRKALIPARQVSPPRRTFITARRIAEPADCTYRNSGSAHYEKGTLILETFFSSVGEVWRFADIRVPGPSNGSSVSVLLRVPGIYGTVAETGASGLLDQDRINEFGAELVIANPTTGRRLEGVQVKAVWADGLFAMSFDVPHEVFEGGCVEAAIVATRPEFIHLSTTYFSRGRAAEWRFRGLKMSRFPPQGEICGEMEFALRHNRLPAHGGRVALVQVLIANPSTERTEIVTVPIRNHVPATFAFSRALISADGRVDISIHEVPEPYEIGIPAKGSAITLREEPAVFEWSYIKAVVLLFCQLMLVASATVAASTFLSGGVAALGGFFTYFCGLCASFVKDVLAMGPHALVRHHPSEQAEEAARASWPVIKTVLRAFVAITPDVSRLDGKGFVLQGVDVPGWNVAVGIGTTLLYAAAFMAVACVIFRRKELG